MMDLVNNDVFLGQKEPASWSCSYCMAIYYDIHKKSKSLIFSQDFDLPKFFEYQSIHRR